MVAFPFGRTGGMSDTASLRLHPKTFLAPFVSAAFWGMAVLVIIDHRGLNVESPVVEIIRSVILACGLVLAGQAYVPLRQALGVSGMLVLAAIVSYLVIGFVTAVALGATTLLAQVKPLWDSFPVVFIWTGAVGCRAMVKRIGVEPVLRGILVILMASCVLTLATPLLQQAGVRSPDAVALSAAGQRFTGSFHDPNIAGFAASFTVSLALSFLAAGRRRWLAYAALTAGCAAVVATFSRTAMLCVTAAAAFFLVLNGRGARGPLVWWLLVVGTVGLALNATVVEVAELLERGQLIRLASFIAIFGGVIDDFGTTERTTLWRLGLEQFRESPLIGNGLNALRHLDGVNFTLGTSMRLGVHNTYLQFAGEAGVVPLALYVLFFVSLLWLRWIAPRSLARDAVIGWGIQIALLSFTIYNTLGLRFVSFLIGVICSLAVVACEGPRTRFSPPENRRSRAVQASR